MIVYKDLESSESDSFHHLLAMTMSLILLTSKMEIVIRPTSKI